MQKSKKIQEINQTKQFKSESLRYINSYLHKKDQVLKEKILIPKSISKGIHKSQYLSKIY